MKIKVAAQRLGFRPRVHQQADARMPRPRTESPASLPIHCRCAAMTLEADSKQQNHRGVLEAARPSNQNLGMTGRSNATFSCGQTLPTVDWFVRAYPEMSQNFDRLLPRPSLRQGKFC